jgi:uncharacterized protein YbbC (DUF1343 family)
MRSIFKGISTVIFFFFLIQKSAFSQEIIVGAADTAAYFPMLKGKKIALVVNQTSLVGGKHLTDFLVEHGLEISLIFAPEHGFRGKADAGEKIANEKDEKTGIQIASLYGKNYKPTPEQLKNCDAVLFDIQDVGARFYTYISTMHYVMAACAENGKKFIVLDRPNPNIAHVDGPILDTMRLRSFVGMHPIPVLHGLTVGELALMIAGEKWLNTKENCPLSVIPCKNYSRHSAYSLPVKPSPNLPDERAIALYASLCLLEGTPASVGRGTDFPFKVFGHPRFSSRDFYFVPKANEGNKKPLFENETCGAVDWREKDTRKHFFSLEPVLRTYTELGKPADFFSPFFDKLIGKTDIKNLIAEGKSEEEIRKTWQEEVKIYLEKRKKYLIYKP